MFARRYRRYGFVLKSFTTGSDFRLPSPTVRFCFEVLCDGERYSLVVTNGIIAYSSLSVRVAIFARRRRRYDSHEVFYYGERFSLVVTGGTILS